MGRRSHQFEGNYRFQIIRKLGEGGMGSVYEAFDKKNNENVAVKTIQRFSGNALLVYSLLL